MAEWNPENVGLARTPRSCSRQSCFTVKHMLITMAVLTGIAVSVTPLVSRVR